MNTCLEQHGMRRMVKCKKMCLYTRLFTAVLTWYLSETHPDIISSRLETWLKSLTAQCRPDKLQLCDYNVQIVLASQSGAKAKKEAIKEKLLVFGFNLNWRLMLPVVSFTVWRNLLFECYMFHCIHSFFHATLEWPQSHKHRLPSISDQTTTNVSLLKKTKTDHIIV